MISRGHEVTVACVPGSRIHEESIKRGVPVVALNIGRKGLKGLAAMHGWLKANPVDIVNTHSSTDSWLVALANLGLQQKPGIVRTRHVSAPVSSNAPTRWLYTTATSHIATTGESLRQMLAKENGFPLENITSVPTGIDPKKFAPAADKSAARAALGLDPVPHYVGIVATLRSWKGHQYLLEAFAGVERPDWRLLIVGDGPQREALEQRSIELGIKDRTTFTGQSDKPEQWLQALDAFCLPSYANEGVPQALLQAMLTSLPIVTTPVGAITEAVQDGMSALVVPPRDAAALRDALLRLADNSELAGQLGHAARARAQANFSREAMLDRMESIFQKACPAA
jgi:glycosyltransferase involved in cell wall biosynthesis